MPARFFGIHMVFHIEQKTCRRAGFAPLSLRLPVARLVRCQTGVQFLLILGLLFALTVFPACSPPSTPAASTTAAAPTQTISIPRPSDTATPARTLTLTASPAPTTTPTTTLKPYASWTPRITLRPTKTLVPIDKVNPPPGIVYRLDNKLYLTTSGGQVQVEQDNTLPEGQYVSPNEQFILEFDWFTDPLPSHQTQTIVNLADGTRTQIWPVENLNLCPFFWVDGQPSVLLATLLEEGASINYSCNRGSPVLLFLDTMQLTILDETGSGWSSPDISPDGRFMAYDLGGEPWIYEFGQGSRPLDVNQYGLDALNTKYLSDPDWSPSGRYLAWTSLHINDQGQEGVVLLDLARQKARRLAPFQVQEFEGSRAYFQFSPSENYLALTRYIYGPESGYVSDIISIDGLFSRRLDGHFGRWSPQGFRFWLELDPGQDKCRLRVESPDGSVRLPICFGDWVVWRSDGRQVITYTYNKDLFWLTDLATGVTLPLDLPSGAEIVRWEP